MSEELKKRLILEINASTGLLRQYIINLETGMGNIAHILMNDVLLESENAALRILINKYANTGVQI